MAFKRWQPPAVFVQSAERSTLLFSCAGVKTIAWLPESCDRIEMESGGRRVRVKPHFLRGFSSLTAGQQQKHCRRKVTALTASVWVKSSHSAAHFHTGSGFFLAICRDEAFRDGCSGSHSQQISNTSPSSALLFDRNVFTAAWWILLLRCGEASRSEGLHQCVCLCWGMGSEGPRPPPDSI